MHVCIEDREDRSVLCEFGLIMVLELYAALRDIHGVYRWLGDNICGFIVEITAAS